MTARCTLTSWDSVPDAVRETRRCDDRHAEMDLRENEWTDLLRSLDEEAPEPIDHLTLPGLLEHPCMPSSYCTADELPANAVMDPAEALELRARIRRRAA